MLLRLNRGGPRRAALYAIGLLCIAAVVLRLGILCLTETDPSSSSSPTLSSSAGRLQMVAPLKYVVDSEKKMYEYNRDMPLIFIGGIPRSGTTLMRAMLDAHPDVRCGQETRVIPRLLQLRSQWMKSEKEALRLEQAGITKAVLDSAVAAFTLEIIVKHGEPAPRLCNKDPLIIKIGTYVHDLFPNAKFIFMIRDGRATVHSIISRKVTITGFDLSSYRNCLKKWNTAVETMNNQCRELGTKRCLRVPYEQLVLHPRQWMETVLEFLDLPWNDSVLHHQDFINNGISLSKVERSSDQVIKPVNLEALTKWVGNIPDDVVKDMADLAPMLSVLGYDPYANPPNYGKPDEIVATNTKEIQQHKGEWEKIAKEMFSDIGSAANRIGGGGGGGGGGGDTVMDKEPSDSPNNTT